MIVSISDHDRAMVSMELGRPTCHTGVGSGHLLRSPVLAQASLFSSLSFLQPAHVLFPSVKSGEGRGGVPRNPAVFSVYDRKFPRPIFCPISFLISLSHAHLLLARLLPWYPAPGQPARDSFTPPSPPPTPSLILPPNLRLHLSCQLFSVPLLVLVPGPRVRAL